MALRRVYQFLVEICCVALTRDHETRPKAAHENACCAGFTNVGQLCFAADNCNVAAFSLSLNGAARFTAIRDNSCAAKAAFVPGWRGRPEGSMSPRCVGGSRSDSSPRATRRHHNREAIAATARFSWSHASATDVPLNSLKNPKILLVHAIINNLVRSKRLH